MDKPPTTTQSLVTKKRVLILIAFLLLLYVVVPRLGNFSQSFAAIRTAEPLLVMLAIALVLVTYGLAAAIYWALALKPLAYRPTLLIQAASAFTNRLLPGGLGTLTLYVQYLRKAGHSVPQAVTVAGANNLLGMLGHGLLLVIVLATTRQAYPTNIQLPNLGLIVWIAVAIFIVAVINLVVFRRFRERAYKITKEVVGYVVSYRRRPLRLAAALGFSIALTLTYIAIFYCCVWAVGLHMPLSYIFLTFTIGLIVGTATPTPGGLVGVEAGLAGGLIAYGADPRLALAATLLYRFLTYWLPLLPGFVVFARIRKLYS